METTATTPEAPRRSIAATVGVFLLRLGVALFVPVVTFLLLRWSFAFMRDSDANKILVTIVALVVGVGAVWVLYIAADAMVSLLPESIRERVRPFVFVGPALIILAVYLIYPVVRTIWFSFFGSDAGEEFVGLSNYIFAFTSEDMLIALRSRVMPCPSAGPLR